jgi:hypothetical protein
VSAPSKSDRQIMYNALDAAYMGRIELVDLQYA